MSARNTKLCEVVFTAMQIQEMIRKLADTMASDRKRERASRKASRSRRCRKCRLRLKASSHHLMK